MQFSTTHFSGVKRTGDSHTTQSDTALKGRAYLDDQPIDPHTLACHLNATSSPDEITSLLQRLNGFYAWVWQTSGEIRAGVDHIRSRPLFYGQKDGHFYLSDDAEWLRQRIGDTDMDPLAREEFQLAGYVTGCDTLFPNVKQLQAGEYLVARRFDRKIHIETHRFYRFLHIEPSAPNEQVLKAELDTIALRCVQRLIDYAAGRQIVVPLSGGYDSRLIVTLLRRLGYHKVVTFTYGVPGNKEAEYSKRVAENLGLPWHFVEYSDDLWREAWRSSEAADYRQTASNHVSLPHIQDWLAVRQLKASNVIASDALFVPGHSGDFVAGSHIPAFVFERNQHDENSLTAALIKIHLSNAPKKGMELGKPLALENRLLDRIRIPFHGSSIELANLYELWDWQERQAKYIVNSVRVYDQFDFDWWLPLWDIEFTRFWEGVPLVMRRGRIWFKDWIIEQYATQCVNQPGASILRNASDRSKEKDFLARVAKGLPSPIFNLLKSIKNLIFGRKHFLAFEGLVPEKEMSFYVLRNYNIIGIYSDLYISKKW